MPTLVQMPPVPVDSSHPRRQCRGVAGQRYPDLAQAKSFLLAPLGAGG